MLKRKSRSEEERWKKKIRKYEDKLRRKSARMNSGDEDIKEDELPLPQDLPAPEFDKQLGVLQEPVSDEPSRAAQNLKPVPEPSAAAAKTMEPVPGTSRASAPTEPAQKVEIQAPAQSEPELIDPELLQAIGDWVPEAAEWGDDINGKLSKIWTPILRDGLKKEAKEEICTKYLLPKNCPLTKSPILNPEISAVLTDTAKNRDLQIITKQNQLGCVLSVLGKIITGMLRKSLDTHGALKLLSDASKLVADSHFTETETRRALIIPILEKSFVDSFKDRKHDSHLFGDKLGEFIKSSSSRGIKKTGQLIPAAETSFSGVNWKGPPPHQFQRSSRTPLNRGCGPRAPPPPQKQARRCAAAPPQPVPPPPAPPPALRPVPVLPPASRPAPVLPPASRPAPVLPPASPPAPTPPAPQARSPYSVPTTRRRR